MKIIMTLISTLIFFFSAAAYANPYTFYDMIKDFLSDESQNQKSIIMEPRIVVNSDETFEVFLETRISNDLKDAICIPSNFYASKSLIPIDPILSVKKADGSMVPPILYPPRIRWPAVDYIVLSPTSDNFTRINLSDYFNFSSMNGLVYVNFSIPAFYCNLLDVGYPVTEKMLKNPIGLNDTYPLVAVDPKDIIVFRGQISFTVGKVPKVH